MNKGVPAPLLRPWQGLIVVADSIPPSHDGDAGVGARFVPLLPRVIELAQGLNFAVLTTLMPDGTPQSHVMWIDSDGEYLLVNTELGRQKHRNMLRDPRVTITIWELGNPYHFVEVRGRVIGTVAEPESRRHIAALTMRYQGSLPDPDLTARDRVVMKVAPERQYIKTAPVPTRPPTAPPAS